MSTRNNRSGRNSNSNNNNSNVGNNNTNSGINRVNNTQDNNRSNNILTTGENSNLIINNTRRNNVGDINNNNNANNNNNNSNINKASSNKSPSGRNNKSAVASIFRTLRNSISGQNNNSIQSSSNSNKSSRNNKRKSKSSNTRVNNSVNQPSTMDRIRSMMPTRKSINDTMAKATDTSGDDWTVTIFQMVVVIVIAVAIFYVSRHLYYQYRHTTVESPILVEGIKNGKHALVVSQDPANPGYRPIMRSENQHGIQFTYEFWIMIEGYEYKRDEWKHVFHKGDAKSYPNRAPGVWLHPETNAMRVYMNTQKQILEWVDVHNMPLRKWVHVALVLDDYDLDVYINGFLKTRKRLSSVPRQNNGDLWINMYGGFEGNLSSLRYHPRAVSGAELHQSIRSGPGHSACIDTGELPPYLDDQWWLQE